MKKMANRKRLSEEEKMEQQFKTIQLCEEKIADLKHQLKVNKEKRSKLKRIISISLSYKEYEEYQSVTKKSVDTLKCKVNFARLWMEKEAIEKEIEKYRETLNSI